MALVLAVILTAWLRPVAAMTPEATGQPILVSPMQEVPRLASAVPPHRGLAPGPFRQSGIGRPIPAFERPAGRGAGGALPHVRATLERPPEHLSPGGRASGSDVQVTPDDQLRKTVLRAASEELVTVLRLDSLSAEELAKIDGVVRNAAYWAVFDDSAVADRVTAELGLARAAGRLTPLRAQTTSALRTAAEEQTVSVIIELGGGPDKESLAILASRVRRVRHVLDSIGAVSADLAPVQLAGLAQLPIVQYIWSNAPVKQHLVESVAQIGVDRLHQYNIKGTGVRVGVVEEVGLQDSHPAFSGRVAAERCSEDSGNHATHVAGIIAADWAPSGVAPGVQLVDAAVCPWPWEEKWDDVIKAIEWAADDSQGNADVINVSLGTWLWQYPRDGTGPVETAVDNVITQGGPDSFHTMVVVSAGNEADDHDIGQVEQGSDPQTKIAWVLATDEDLQITLWWDDATNDLDLKLIAPDGATEVDLSDGTNSALGTNPGIVYERVSASAATLASHGTGFYQLKVIAHDVPSGPQPYHVAIDYGGADFLDPHPAGTTTVPGNARYALAVGSVGDGSCTGNGCPVNERSDFSSQGPTDAGTWGQRIKPEIMAPGEQITSSVAGSGRDTMSGTSQAAPHVAGAAALLLEAAGKRTDGTWQLTYDELRGAIIDGAMSLDGNHEMDNVTGAGLISPTNVILTGSITHKGNQYFQVTPAYTGTTYAGSEVISFDWESVAARWDSPSSDLDLYLYRLDTGGEITRATTVASTYEKIAGRDLAPDDHAYVLRVHGWYVSGSDSFSGVSTNPVRSVDPPALDVFAETANPDEIHVGETFAISFAVQNNGELPARDTAATLGLPAGVELVGGGNPRQIGAIPPGGQGNAAWTLRATSAGGKDFTVEVSSDAWGATWHASGGDSVSALPPVGPLAYVGHVVDDDQTGQSTGNADGVVNCGETIELFVELENQGGGAATGVNATVSESDPYITILYNTSSDYPDLASGASGINTGDFDLAVDSGTPDGQMIHIDLDISAANGGPWTDSFDLAVVCNRAPDEPSAPSPPHEAVDRQITVDLSWTGGDPDPGEAVTYDVYFEAGDPSPGVLICDDIAAPACDPGPLEFETEYFWYVVATDEHEASTAGDVWTFSTEDVPTIGPLVHDDLTIDDDSGGNSSGDDDGIVECGETIELFVDLRNQGTGAATGIQATISESDPNVALLFNDTSPYPDISGGATGTNSDDFDFTVDPDTPHGHVIHFDLDVTAANGGPWSVSIDLPVTCILPDLLVSDITASPPNPQDGDPVEFVVDLLNQGDVSTSAWGSFDVRCYLDDSTTPFDSVVVSSLGARASTPVTCDWTGVVGTHEVTAVVDEVDAIPEWNPVNNERTEMIAVGAACSDPYESNDAWSQATATAYGTTVSDGDVCPAGDVDYYAFAGQVGDTIIADVDAQSLGSALDSYLVLYNTDGVSQLDQNDNHDGPDSRIVCQLPANGTYYLKVQDANHPSAGGATYFYALSLRRELNAGPLVYESHSIDDDNIGLTNGDSDGVIDCGEDIFLHVALRNQGSAAALDVFGHITSTDTYLNWGDTIGWYADIGGGSVVTQVEYFAVAVDPGTPDGHVLHFDLGATAANAGPWSDSFTATVTCNQPPNSPSNPSPPSAATDQPIDVELSWAGGGDPDPGDSVTYDVYFEAIDATPDVLICQDLTSATCDPGVLDYHTVYYWYVLAKDSRGGATRGPTWYFLTTRPPVGPVEHVGHSLVDDGYWGPGDNDGQAECGEAVAIPMTVLNHGTYTATSVGMSIAGFDDPHVTIIRTPLSYPDIPGGATYDTPWWDDYVIGVFSSAPDGHLFEMTMTFEAANGGPWTDTLDIPISCTRPDLVVTDIVPDPATQLHDDAVQLTVELANEGDVATPAETSFDVECYTDGNSTPFDSQTVGTSLAAGGTTTATCDWTAVVGTHAITVVVDGGDSVAEASESNNAYAETLLVLSCNDPFEPNSGWGAATRIDAGDKLAGATICPAGDEDYYQLVNGLAGDLIAIDIEAQSIASSLDADLYVYADDMATQLAHSDNHDGLDPRIAFRLPYDGIYYLLARAATHPSSGGPGDVYSISLDRGAGPLTFADHAVDDDTAGWSSGNADGIVNCGESIELAVNLHNAGSTTAISVSATISASDTYVGLLYGPDRTYSDIPGESTGGSSKPFALQVDAGTPHNHTLIFDLAAQSIEGYLWMDAFSVTVSCPWRRMYLPLALRAYTPAEDLDWDDDIRVNDDTGSGIQLRPDLAVSGDGRLYAVWEDYRNGTYPSAGDIYFAYSTNGGKSWSANVRVNDDGPAAATRRYPHIAVAPSGDVYVAWEDHRNDPHPTDIGSTPADQQNPDVYLARLRAGAASFDGNTLVFANADRQWAPDVEVDGYGRVFVAWYDQTGDIFYGNSVVARSTDGGASFGSPVVVDNHTAWALTPRLAVNRSNNYIFLVYQGHPGYYKPFFTHSTNGGVTWSTDARLDAGPDRDWYDAAREIEIAVDTDNNVLVIWADERNDPDNCYTGCASAHDEFDIYASYSLNGGVTWPGTDNVLVNDDSTYAALNAPSPAVAPSGTLVAVWRDSREGDSVSDIHMATSTDHGASWSANRRVDHAPSGYQADHPAVVVSPSGLVYVVWHDLRNGDWDIYLTGVGLPGE